MKRSASDHAVGGPGGSVKGPRLHAGGAPEASVVDEFSSLKGQLLVEAVFAKYGSGIMSIKWLSPNGERNIRRDPCNRPIMESLAEAYCDRILQSGLNVDCSGRAWMVCGSVTSHLPANAITYNHRSEAMYRAIEREPSNPFVMKALSTGLENVRMLSADTPIELRERLCAMHNNYHDGVADNWVTLLDRSGDLMQEWDIKVNGPNGTGLTTRNSQYDQHLETFIFREKQAQGWGDSFNFFKTTNVLNNYLLKYFIKEDVRAWCNEHMNFADFKLSNRDIILMTHQLTVLLVNNMNKYYPKDYIGLTILEAIKFCVPARHAGTGDRLIPNLFVKPGAETLAIMNYVSTPMASSAAFKKLDQERESALEEQKTSEPSSQVQVQPSNPNASSTGPLPSNKGRRGVKKSKAKAKTAAKASCEVEDPIVDMMDIKNWTSMAYPLVSDTGSADLNRHKTALDDFLNIFHALVDRHLPSKKGDDVQSQLQPATTKPLFQHGMSIFLEFVWSGSAAINGKFARAYTTFRSEIITFITTALEIAGGQGGSGTRVSISTRLSDLIGEDMPTIGFGLGNSKLEDESDESRAIQRIKMSVDALQNPSSGFPSFAADVLPLPLDYHEKFNAAKTKLAVDPEISSSLSLQQVLQKVFACMQEAIPQAWINFAADVSDLWAIRLGFVGGSEKLLLNRKDILERLITIRSLYTLSLLRDLGKLKKTQFDPSVNLLISSLQVDLDNALKIAASKFRQTAGAADVDEASDATESLAKPHPAASLIPGFDSLLSADTWAKNWTSLLSCKTQEGAYSYLKVFTGDRPGKMEDQEAASKAKKGAGSKDQGEEEEVDDAHSDEEGEIVSRLGLSRLALTGMEVIESSKTYEELFGTNPGHLTALDIKLLELRLELLLWDQMRSSKDFAEQFVVWNFGDAKEESAAYSTGDRSKVAKVSKKVQSERLLFTDLASLKKDDAILHRMRFPCLGSVSAARTMHSLPLCEVFGIKFFVHPPPQPSPTNPLVVPAWLVGVTNKVECATVKESTHIIKCAIGKTCVPCSASDLISDQKENMVCFDMVVPMMVPASGLTVAIVNSEEEVPMLKYVPKKRTGPKALDTGAETEASSGPVVGFSAALSVRAEAMEKHGLSTALPSLSKEEKKAEKDRKKVLANAKHLMK